MIRVKQPAITMEEVTDVVELAKARAQDERFERNWVWFEVHAAEIYARHRGKCLCISGQELFAADTPEDVLALACAAHPEDDGRFTRYIPQERTPRISCAMTASSAPSSAAKSWPVTGPGLRPPSSWILAPTVRYSARIS
jgi:hypothetical protein